VHFELKNASDKNNFKFIFTKKKYPQILQVKAQVFLLRVIKTSKKIPHTKRGSQAQRPTPTPK